MSEQFIEPDYANMEIGNLNIALNKKEAELKVARQTIEKQKAKGMEWMDRAILAENNLMDVQKIIEKQKAETNLQIIEVQKLRAGHAYQASTITELLAILDEAENALKLAMVDSDNCTCDGVVCEAIREVLPRIREFRETKEK